MSKELNCLRIINIFYEIKYNFYFKRTAVLRIRFYYMLYVSEYAPFIYIKEESLVYAF